MLRVKTQRCSEEVLLGAFAHSSGVCEDGARHLHLLEVVLVAQDSLDLFNLGSRGPKAQPSVCYTQACGPCFLTTLPAYF